MESDKVGRPTDYTQELADTICTEIARGNSLRKIEKMEGMPSGVTIFAWLRTYPEFLKQYERACDERTDFQNELILEIGDEAISHSQTVDPKASNAVVSAYKLKADNLKWSMSKMKPKKYGDRLDHTTNGKDLPTPLLYAIRNNDVDDKSQ